MRIGQRKPGQSGADRKARRSGEMRDSCMRGIGASKYEMTRDQKQADLNHESKATLAASPPGTFCKAGVAPTSILRLLPLPE